MDQKSSLEALRQLKNLLVSPEAWTQHTSARDKAGAPVRSASIEACSWCLIGTLQKVTTTVIRHDDPYKLFGLKNLTEWNDMPGRTYQEVIDLLDSRIDELETK